MKEAIDKETIDQSYEALFAYVAELLQWTPDFEESAEEVLSTNH